MSNINRRILKLSGAGLLGWTLSSCATSVELDSTQYQHIFALGKDGRSVVERVPGGERDPDFSDQLAAVDKALKAHATAANGGEKRVLLFFHGGMNGVEAGCRNAKLKLAAMHKARSTKDPEAQFYPIFVNWDSGPISSWGFGLFQTLQGRINRIPGVLTSPFRLVAALGRAITRTPETIFWQGVRNIRETAKGVNVLEVPDGWSGQTSVDPGKPNPSFIKKHVQPWIPGIFRVVTTPLADTWGVTAYGDMRRTAHLPFVLEEDLRFDPSLAAAKNKFGRGVLAELGKKILLLQESHDDLRVTVVAHSMGAHIANELLRRYPSLAVDRVVFLAPACSIREFASTTLEFVKHSTEEGAPFECEFFCVTLHPDRERSETMFGGFVPHGSLLVYVDDYLTTHHSVEEGTLGTWNNLMNALPTLEIDDSVKKLMHVTMLPWESDEQTHGAVDNIAFWKRDVLLGK